MSCCFRNINQIFFLDFRHLDLENLSVSDDSKYQNPKLKLAARNSGSHRKLCRSKAIYSRPGYHATPYNIAPPRDRKPEFLNKRNLEDLELLETTISIRYFSTQKTQIPPVYESVLE